eukprot:GHVT01087134.1.p1 GENE.GHVT01087134.1~~GHVT01087134.1.p1  ORF type:complete len:133 (+),score=3.92 GHVT01087134.1:301-699(+)
MWKNYQQKILLMMLPMMRVNHMTQNDLIKTIRMNYLFDFYQALLTEKQRNYLQMFYLEDYSLSEIADTFNVSRQAVYDNIRRTGDLVEDYETKLGLYRNFEKRKDLYDQIKQHSDNAERVLSYIKQLEEIDE